MYSVSGRIVSLGIGEIIVVSEATVVSTILGSCVAVCIFTPDGRYGGINHFALPHLNRENFAKLPEDELYRYGDYATKTLIEQILEFPGMLVRDLRAKIVGGAAVIGQSDIGRQNINVARSVLKQFGVIVVGEDAGGARGRRVYFYTESGRLRIGEVEDKKQSLSSSTSITSIAAPSRPLPVVLAKKIRVLIVDDSRTIQELLKSVLTGDPDIDVVGVADNPLEAEKILAVREVDVITLDIHMPVMDGVTFLASLMERRPHAVIMITAMSMEDGNEVLRALELGAVDYIQKPKFGDMTVAGPLIREKVRAAATAKVRRSRPGHRVATQRAPKQLVTDRGRALVVIGASTGGTEAIRDVLTNLPAEIPPILIVQHIPAMFSKAFADRLNDLCPFVVKEAESGDLVQSGQVLIAPGGFQMSLAPDGISYKIKITDDPPVNRHKPSVDVLFESVVRHASGNAMGIILTGMGGDGAAGLLSMKQKGFFTVAQDERTCVVFGMPKEAIRMGAAIDICPLEDVSGKIMTWWKNTRQKRIA